jgi:hypothetical protein
MRHMVISDLNHTMAELHEVFRHFAVTARFRLNCRNVAD